METKSAGFYRNVKPFENMAHWVGFLPEAFESSFIEKTQKIADVKNRRERVSGLTAIFFDLGTYITWHGITIDEINKARREKAKDYGLFDEGFIGIQNGTKKLVRDNYPNLPARDGEEIVYERVDRQERLKALDVKLVEESSELIIDAKTRKERVRELADVYEVLDAILKYRNIDMREIDTRLQAIEIMKRRKLSKEK